ncbi:MAG: Transrane exosortase (Exosortase EpsH) [Bacteroidota bacterium]|jgi:exosortase family protein XrtF|nr:Transrane exosortase (Exosortase EpsH) [Bacteroidota bacterium]
MFLNLKHNKFQFFILLASSLYGLCYVIYEFVIKRYTPWDQLFIRKIINFSQWILEESGYRTFASREVNDIQVMGIDGSNGVWIGGPCNGITLMFLFAIFVIAYPGNFKNKLWYVPLGILIVHGINILRIIALALIANSYPEYLHFNHTYTFTFIAYSAVFGLWMLWVNKFSNTIKSAK